MTIKDIAKECGFGLGTVSRVINNQPGVSEQTRKAIQAVIDKHNFVLNQNAKRLKELEHKNIVILVKGTSSPLLTGILECIQKQIESLPYTANVVILDEYDNEAQVASRIFYEQKPLGFIFLGGSPDVYKEDFSKIKIPCVVISNQAHDVENCNLSSVSIDDRKAAEFATMQLIQNGHKKIGIIGGDLKSSELTKRRFQGFLDAMKANGLSFDEEKQYAVAKYSFESGASAAKTLLRQYPDMTAIFSMSDVMAIGAIRSLHDEGFSVPEDISITGFDGLPFCDYYCPKITTIRQLKDELANKGLSALLDSMEQQKPSTHTLVPFEFVQGESVKNIRE